MPADVDIEVRPINGEPGFIGRRDGVTIMVVALEAREAEVTAVRIMVNPDKLAAV